MAVSFVSPYSWLGLLAKGSGILQAQKFKGAWRLRKFVKRLTGSRYIQTRYLDKGVVWACPDEPMGRQIFWHGAYESYTIALIQMFVRQGYNFVDVGANQGFHTIAAAMCRQSAEQQFVAFEPDPKALLLLQKNCRLNEIDFIQAEQIAISDTEGTVNLSGREMGHTTIMFKIEGADLIVCPSTSLDQRLSGLKTASLVKIDVEGAELLVLRGGLTWLSQVQDLAIICEIWAYGVEQGFNYPHDVFGELDRVGCTAYAIIDDDRQTLHRITPRSIANIDSEIFEIGGSKLLNIVATKGTGSNYLAQQG